MPKGSATTTATLVGRNIRSARTAASMTQRELGAAIDADPQLISKWERGEHEPSPTARIRLAMVLFGGDVSRLYRDHERDDREAA